MKKIKALVVTTLLTVMLMGCTSNKVAEGEHNSEKVEEVTAEDQLRDLAPTFKLIEYKETRYLYTYHAYDEDTNVEYIVSYSPKKNGTTVTANITVLWDENGKPKLYDKGE